MLSGNDQLEELRLAENTNSALERIIQYEGMQEVSTTNEQKQCSNPETSNAIVRGNTLHIVCQFLLLYGYLHLIVQTVGRASRAQCSSHIHCKLPLHVSIEH